MSDKEKIMTPDEMLDGAVVRILNIAEWVLKSFPRPIHESGKEYKFKWDPGAVYVYIGSDHGHRFPDNIRHLYERRSDGKLAQMTKYSEAPEPINQ